MSSLARRSKLTAPDFERLARTPLREASLASSGIRALSSDLALPWTRKAERVAQKRSANSAHEFVVFVDEAGASTSLTRKHGRRRRGRRLRAAVPHGHYKTVTLVAGLRLRGLAAPRVYDRPMNAASVAALWAALDGAGCSATSKGRGGLDCRGGFDLCGAIGGVGNIFSRNQSAALSRFA